jgi:hypothetical protein
MTQPATPLHCDIALQAAAHSLQALAQALQCSSLCFAHSSPHASHISAQSAHISLASSLPRAIAAAAKWQAAAQSKSSAMHLAIILTLSSFKQDDAQ